MSPIPQVTRSAGLQVEPAGDLQLSDIQGLFRGRGIRVRDEGHADTEIGFLDDQSRQKDDILDPKQTTGAKSRTGSRAEQRRARQALSGKLPDFEEELPAFEGFLGILRRAQKDRDYGNLRTRAGKLFGDPSVRHGALEAAAAILDEEGGDPSLTKELREAAEELLRERGQEVQAGYNISSAVAERTGNAAPLEIRDLRDFYREAVFGYRTTLGTYEFLIDHAPSSLAASPRENGGDLTAAERRVSGAVDFLLHCLSADLESGEPSRDLVYLKAVNDGIRNVGFLTQSQSACRAFLEKYNGETAGAVPVEPVPLLRTTLQRAENEQSGPQDYLSIAEQFRLPHDSLRINFMTQLQGIVRGLPPTVLPSENHRQQALQSIQLCMDSLIESEFEEESHA